MNVYDVRQIVVWRAEIVGATPIPSSIGRVERGRTDA